jgi:bifunctional non-homologous end joining protein LigD
LTALPDRIPPQLATLVDAPPNGAGWVYEIKLDGYRILSRIERGDTWGRPYRRQFS